MSELNFTIFGDPVGYTRQTKRGLWSKPAQKYREYQKLVALSAVQFISLPMEATELHPVRIETQCYFRNHRFPDTENVHKGIVDALFYKSKLGDKWVCGEFGLPRFDKANPRVEVRLIFLEAK